LKAAEDAAFIKIRTRILLEDPAYPPAYPPPPPPVEGPIDTEPTDATDPSDPTDPIDPTDTTEGVYFDQFASSCSI